jgi:hypothetical protein
MTDRFTRPLMWNLGENKGQLLSRIEYDSPPFDEKGLQEILRLNPELLAIEHLDAQFAPAICIGREVKLSAWPLDNLYISPRGFLTIVETKLWKNPGARREVVAQILEYVKELSKRNYLDIEGFARAYADTFHPGSKFTSLFEWIRSHASGTDTDINEPEFADTISRSLRAGRILLIIAGEGIQESAHDLVEHMRGTPQFGFNLNLVELGCFRVPGDGSKMLIIPRVVVRTREVERAVVRVEMIPPADSQVKVLVSTDKERPADVQTVSGTIGFEDFAERLRESTGAAFAERLLNMLERLETAGIFLRPNGKSLTLILRPDPQKERGGGTIATLDTNGGLLFVTRLRTLCCEAGGSEKDAEAFWDHLHSLDDSFPDAAYFLTGDKKRVAPEIVSKWLPQIEETVIKLETNVRRGSAEQV